MCYSFFIVCLNVSILQIHLPYLCIYIAISMVKSSLTFSHTISPISIIFGSILPRLRSFTMLNINCSLARPPLILFLNIFVIKFFHINWIINFCHCTKFYKCVIIFIFFWNDSNTHWVSFSFESYISLRFEFPIFLSL